MMLVFGEMHVANRSFFQGYGYSWSSCIDRLRATQREWQRKATSEGGGGRLLSNSWEQMARHLSLVPSEKHCLVKQCRMHVKKPVSLRSVDCSPVGIKVESSDRDRTFERYVQHLHISFRFTENSSSNLARFHSIAFDNHGTRARKWIRSIR